MPLNPINAKFTNLAAVLIEQILLWLQLPVGNSGSAGPVSSFLAVYDLLDLLQETAYSKAKLKGKTDVYRVDHIEIRVFKVLKGSLTTLKSTRNVRYSGAYNAENTDKKVTPMAKLAIIPPERLGNNVSTKRAHAS